MSSIVAVNAKNQFRGTIKKLVPGSVVSEIVIETSAGIVSSVITTSSAKELELLPGVAVLALFKATEVSLAKLEPKASGEIA